MRVLPNNNTIGKQIPEDVLADRDRRANMRPASITAARFGDPLPGYSALDCAPSIAAEITSDPLDGLLFKRRKTGARYG